MRMLCFPANLVSTKPFAPVAAAMPPSKGKRRPQQPAASPHPSPRTPSSRDPSDGEGGVDLPSIAAAAAAQFPALVPRGGDGCFVGAVAELAPMSGTGTGLARLWLSEAAMVGAGMRPGCLVSVSSCLTPLLCLCLVPSPLNCLFLQIVSVNYSTLDTATISSTVQVSTQLESVHAIGPCCSNLYSCCDWGLQSDWHLAAGGNSKQRAPTSVRTVNELN